MPHISRVARAICCACTRFAPRRVEGRQSFGTIDKRGTASRPRYRARFDDPTYTDPGRVPRISAPHTFPTKREAEVWLASQWSAIAAGTWEHPDVIAARAAEAARQQTLKGITVSEWADA